MSGIGVEFQSASVADAASMADWDKPASDISNAEFQDRLADSLLDPEGARPMSELYEHFDDVADERMQEEWANGEQVDFAEGAEGTEETEQSVLEADATGQEFADDEEFNKVLDHGEDWLREQENAQQPEARELTPAEINAGIEQLGQAVEQLGLNDPAAAQQLAYDLTAPFSAAPNSIDADGLGSTMSKVVLSALQIHEAQDGNSNLGPILPQAAQAFTAEFLAAFGIDPRMMEVDSQRFAGVVLVGTLNFLDAVANYGPRAGLEQLNGPAGAEWFARELNACFGINAPMARETALHLADAGGRYILSLLGKLPQAAERQEQPARRAQSRRTSRMSKEEAHAMKAFPGLRIGEYHGAGVEG